MFCPNCGYEQSCGCTNCAPSLKPGQKPWIVVGNTDIIMCANCELSAHIDWWEGLAIEIANLRGDWPRGDIMSEISARIQSRG